MAHSNGLERHAKDHVTRHRSNRKRRIGRTYEKFVYGGNDDYKRRGKGKERGILWYWLGLAEAGSWKSFILRGEYALIFFPYFLGRLLS